MDEDTSVVEADEPPLSAAGEAEDLRSGTLDGLELRYTDTGAGEPVLLVHGLGSDHTIWAVLAPLLPGSWRVVIPDLRGHGLSAKPEGPYSVELFAGDLWGLLQSLRIDRAHVIGHSLGGAVALRLALDHPGAVRSLTVISGFCGVDDRLRDLFQGLLVTAQAGGYGAFFDRALELANTPEFVAANAVMLAAAKEVMVRNASLSALVATLHACMKVDLTAQLPRVSVPTLVLAGAQDVFTGVSAAQAIADAVPGARTAVIAGAGHNVPVEKPRETYAELQRFLSACSTG